MGNNVVLSFFSYNQNRFWAFTQMQRAIPKLSDCSGIKFFKTLGTGSSSGFSLWPDFSTYAILTVWEDESKAIDFLKNSKLMKKFISRSASQQHFSLHTLQTHGLWGKTNPFKAVKRNLAEDEFIGIITRATIRPSRLFEFWRAVPKASKAIQKAKGVIWYKGIGEWPLIQQATFSIWKSLDDVRNFAYKNIDHSLIVKKTKKRNWYSEDMFTRFAVKKIIINQDG